MHKVFIYLCTYSLCEDSVLQLIDNGHGCDGSLEHLLDCGGNLNLVNNFGHTPLHLAARHGDTLTTSFLIFKGASVHAMDEVSYLVAYHSDV